MYNGQVVNREFSPQPQECFRANNNQFVWIIPKVGSYPEEKITSLLSKNCMAAYLGKKTTLCGRKVLSHHRADLFMIVDSVKQFFSIALAEDHFLDPDMHTQS